MLLGTSSGCSPNQDESEQEEEEGKDPSGQDTGSAKEPEGEPTPTGSSEEEESTTTTQPEGSSSSTGGSSGDSKPDERDCDKIEWGTELKEGGIIDRGDVEGYVDSDGNGEVEQEAREAGMCQFHKTGKKCGLVLYSRRT